MPVSNIWIFFSLISLPILLGWFLLSLFFPKAPESWPEKLGLSFGLGLGIITVIQITFLSLGIRITYLNLIPAIISLLIVVGLKAAVLWRRDKGPSFKKEKESFNWVSKIILIFILIQGIWVVIKAFNLPIITDDGVAVWGIKAKAIYFSGLFGSSFSAMVSRISNSVGGNYPLLMPLAENYINIFSAEWNDLYPKIISPLYYFSFLLAFFGLLKRFTDKNYALIFSFFLSSLPFLADITRDAIADLPFTYYCTISFILIIIWMQDRKNNYLYLSAVFSGLAIWTKNEGYASFLINLAIIILFIILGLKSRKKQSLKALAGFLAITIPVIVLVAYYQHLTGVEGIINRQTLSFIRLIKNSERLPYILYELQRQLLGTPNKWNLLGPLFIFSLIINFKRAFSSFYLYILLAIILNFSLLITVYVLSSYEIHYQIGCSQYRIVMHFLPLMLFFSATILYQKNIGRDEKS